MKRVEDAARAVWPRATCGVYGSSDTESTWFLSDLDLRVAPNEPMTFLSPGYAVEELAEALRRSREDVAPPRRDVVKTDRDHPIVLDDSQEDVGPIVLDESQEEVEPARPSAEEVRAARLARLG